MADSFEYFGKRNSYGSGSERGGDEDFEEEDVWSVVNEKSAETSSSKLRTSVSLTPRRLVPTASRIMIPRGGNNENKQVLQQSAPVNIPDWSKIYRKNLRKGKGGGSKSSHGFMDGDDDDDDDDVRNEDEDEDVDDDDKVPPHEWIAKKLARSQISSFSVCEGVGRTLKGRDLSKVRNAVLTKTGFLE